MDITFQGFQPSLPFSIYILLLLIAVALSWWSYRHYEAIHTFARYSLMGLRGLVFFILLIILINPLFETLTVSYVKPSVSVFLDNSQSVSVEKGRYEGKVTYGDVLNHLKFGDRPDINFSIFAFGDGSTRAKADTLNLESSKTNLYSVFDQISQNSTSTDAAILLTDGIYTVGQDPSYLARSLNTPVYVVGMGDTVSVRDLIVKNVVTSNKGYTHTEHTVETTIINDGFPGKNITVQLTSSGKVVASKSVSPSEEKSSHTLRFNIPLQEEGLHQYHIRIPKLEEEWTDANNEKTFSIDVRSNRDRVLHIAFEIHPDVKTMRRILGTDQNISLASRTWIGGKQFLEGSLPQSPDTLDLLVLHGYPHSNISDDLHKKISTLSEQLPIIFVRTPRQDLTQLPSSLQSLLPVSVKSHENALQSSFYPVEAQTGHTVMELQEVSYDNLPSIYAPIQNMSISPSGSPLFRVKYQGSKTQVPFIALQQLGNKRSTLINGYGFFKMKQHYENATRAFITDLINNLVAWNAAETDDQLLTVEPGQKVFDGNDPVLLNAFLRNESDQPESDAAVNITLSGDPVETKQYTMDNEGEGKYSLDLRILAEGVYKFKAEATKAERTIATYQGEFSVAPTRIEYVNTTRNDHFLQQVARQSGGQFYDFTQVDKLWDDLEKAGILDENRKQQISQYYPYQHTLWFIIIVVLLGAEWLLRKYFALP